MSDSDRALKVSSATILQESDRQSPTPASDRHRLALLKHYQSLMPLAQEARKPIFHLKPADGAIGSHRRAVRAVQADFQALAPTIAQRVGLELPELPGIDESVLATRP